jgi:hypothetical protein
MSKRLEQVERERDWMHGRLEECREQVSELRAYAELQTEALREIHRTAHGFDHPALLRIVGLTKMALAKNPAPNREAPGVAPHESGDRPRRGSEAGPECVHETGKKPMQEAQERIQRDIATKGTARVQDVFTILGDPPKGVTLPASEAMNELARQVVSTPDTRTEAEIVRDGAAFVMGPGGDEGTRACRCAPYGPYDEMCPLHGRDAHELRHQSCTKPGSEPESPNPPYDIASKTFDALAIALFETSQCLEDGDAACAPLLRASCLLDELRRPHATTLDVLRQVTGALEALHALVHGECPSLLRDDHHDQMAADAIAAGNAVLEGSRHQVGRNPSPWVSVEERVPADDTTVVVCLHDGQIVTGWWAPGINEWRDTGSGARFTDMGANVTHWTPLPEQPDYEFVAGKKPPARYCPKCGASNDAVGEIGAACWTKGCDGQIACGR